METISQPSSNKSLQRRRGHWSNQSANCCQAGNPFHVL